MPWKHKTPETQSRVRENQRRSRARQKDLIDDLQKRLRHHEQLECQATLEMQQVCRYVAQENRGLRAMLANKSVSDAEVEDFLRSWSSCQEPEIVRETVLRQHEEEEDDCRNGAHHWPRNTLDRQQLRGVEWDDAAPQQPDHVRQAAAAKPLADGIPAELEHDGTRSSLETLCDVAARIIADFQGHGDTGRARAALGCVGNNICVVKNTDIFRLIDETG